MNELTSYGLSAVSKLGNISGMHIEDEDSQYFKLSKNTLFSNSKQLNKVTEVLEDAIE